MNSKSSKTVFVVNSMSYRLVKRILRFIPASPKYEPYKINNFEKIGKIENFKTNFSLATGDKEFWGALCNWYRWECELVNRSCFESFIIAWRIRGGKAQYGPWSHYWGNGGHGEHHENIVNILFVNLIIGEAKIIFMMDLKSSMAVLLRNEKRVFF